MPNLFAPLSIFGGLLVGYSALAQPASNDWQGELLKGVGIVAGYAVLVVLNYLNARRTRKNEKRLEVTEDKVIEPETLRQLKANLAVLTVDQARTGKVVDQLTTDLNETREERDRFKESWSKEQTEHSKTKLRLTEEVETNVELVKVNIEKHNTNEELQKRLEVLEKKVESYQPIELMVNGILAGISNAVTVGITAAYASLPRQTGEQKTVSAPTPEVIGQN